MGKIYQGILGKVSGKVGSVVGSSWKGIATLRIYNNVVANPRTAGQIAQRSAFKQFSQLAKSLLAGLIKPYWDKKALRMSGYNSFIKANLANGAAIDLISKFVASKGNLTTNVVGMSISAADELGSVTHDPEVKGRYDLDTDQMNLVVVNHTKKEAVFVQLHSEGMTAGQATREDALMNFNTADLPSNWAAGDALYGALVAIRPDGSETSETIGLTAIAKN